MRCILLLIALISTTWSEQNSLPAGVLTAVNGDISIIRTQFTAPVQAHILDYLFEGDTLVINEKSSATIFYKSGFLQTIDVNSHYGINTAIIDTLNDPSRKYENTKDISWLFSEVCDLKQKYDEMELINDTEDEDTPIFLIRYPGNTALIDPRPDIVWNKHPGANWYTMKICQGSEIISSIATTDTMFSYPENEEDMLPGHYKIRVLAVHNSDTLCKINRSLTILDSLSVQKINKTIKMIAQQKSDRHTSYLLKAVFYRKQLLRLKAIEALKELLALNPGSSILYRGLAELYRELGMSELGNAFLNLSKQTITTPQMK